MGESKLEKLFGKKLDRFPPPDPKRKEILIRHCKDVDEVLEKGQRSRENSIYRYGGK